MQTIGTGQSNSSQATQQLNNNPPKKLQGFAAHPENINRKGPIKREWTFKGLIEEALEEAGQTKDGQTVQWKRAFIKRLVSKAVTGDLKAMEMVMDRLDGKPLQPVDHTTLGEKIVGPIVYQPTEDK